MSAPQQIDFSKYLQPTQAPAQSTPAAIDFTKYETPPAQASPSWWDSVSDFGKNLWNKVSPVANVESAAQATSHPIDTLKNDASARKKIYDAAEASFQKGNYVEGAAHLLYGSLPFLGPQLDEAGEDFANNRVAAGAGKSVGLGLSMAAPAAIGEAVSAAKPTAGVVGPTQSLAQRMYQSALKPSTTLSTGEVANMVNTGLENKIPVSAAGVEKLGDLVNDLNSKVKAQIDAGNAAGATVNKYQVANRLSQMKNTFATQVNPEADLNAIKGSQQEFLSNNPDQIPLSDAQAMKVGTYKQLQSKAYGELGTATVEAQKALARGLKEEIASQFPEVGDLNAQESKLLGLDDALERAVRRNSNHQMIGIGTPIAAGATKAITGSSGAAGISAILKAVIDDPAVKSHLAIALNKKGGITLPAAATKIAAYSDALGAAANAKENDDQNNQ